MTTIVPVLLSGPDALAALGTSADADGLLVIYSPSTTSASSAIASITSPAVHASVTAHLAADAASSSSVSLLVLPASAGVPGNRLLLSPVVSLLGDTDDVRRYTDAARAALVRAKKAGITRPLVVMDDPLAATRGGPHAARIARDFAQYAEAVLLGLLTETYVPLQAREHFANVGRQPPAAISTIRMAASDAAALQTLTRVCDWVAAVDAGRCIARDVGGADPERMAPLRCAEYIQQAFAGVDNVSVTVVTDLATIKKEYPLLDAVARCSLAVKAHWPAVVRLEYHSAEPSKVKENLFFIGKGVTYDTGGADVKTDGHMRGMSRDKCGAASCAGFMKTVSMLKPTGVNVVATLGFVRNSIGAGSYVSDEILLSRAGVRVLVGNTDAEGRMVMCDLLAESKERALTPKYASIPSRLFTVATLTGHAVLAVGEGYTASLDNGPARESGVTPRLVQAGHKCGDPFEMSTLRREDYDMLQPTSENEDVCQANSKPSSQTSRGHQYPMAFLAIASGLTSHGLDSQHPIAYTHVDIAGSAEEPVSGLSLMRVTGSPVAAFTAAFC